MIPGARERRCYAKGKALEMQNRKAKVPRTHPEPFAEVDRRVTELAENIGNAMQQNSLKHGAIAGMGAETKQNDGPSGRGQL